MPIKETLQKRLEESEAKNQKLLLTLIQIQTSPSWNERNIRAHISNALKETFTMQYTDPEKPKRIRKVKELEPA